MKLTLTYQSHSPHNKSREELIIAEDGVRYKLWGPLGLLEKSPKIQKEILFPINGEAIHNVAGPFSCIENKSRIIDAPSLSVKWEDAQDNFEKSYCIYDCAKTLNYYKENIKIVGKLAENEIHVDFLERDYSIQF